MDRTWLPVRQRLAAERAPLRRAAGPEQGRDGEQVRRRAGAGLAPQLRHAAAARSTPTTRAASAATRATPSSRRRQVPLTECLKDTVARVLPCWNDTLAPAIRAGQRVLVAAHGNSMRALVKYLDGISRRRHRRPEHPERHPAGLRTRRRLKPIRSYYLGDAEAAAKAARRWRTRARPEHARPATPAPRRWLPPSEAATAQPAMARRAARAELSARDVVVQPLASARRSGARARAAARPAPHAAHDIAHTLAPASSRRRTRPPG